VDAEGNPFGVQFYKATTRGSLRSPLAIVGCPFGARNARVKLITALPEGATAFS